MALLDQYRRDLNRARMAVGGDRQRVVTIDKKIIAKRGELGRAKSSSTQQRLARELERLDRDRVAAQEKVTKREKAINDLASKVSKEETKAAGSAMKEQKRQDAARTQQARRVEGLLSATSSAVEDLTSRVTGIEDALLDRVRHDVASDPVGREHDVFLSHAFADNEVATQLYDELKARGLDTWFDGAELHLGESLMRQIDRGIARSRCGVLLITEAFLEGRFWTEREMTALVGGRRRVIPVLHGVTFEDLSAYSPILSDFVGLDMDLHGLGEIADQITAALTNSS